jgi:aminoglycoside phosphotransferase (APT) family kinase protein
MAVPETRDPAVTRKQLAGWLADQLGSDIEVSNLVMPSQGVSNETILFDANWTEGGAARREQMVARVQPDTNQLFLENDVLLQWRMMEGVAASGVPEPTLWFAEPSGEVLGAPFFVMGRVEGRVPVDIPSYAAEGWVMDLSPAQRGVVWDNGLQAMATIHAIDPGDRFGFLERPGRGAAGLDQYLSHVGEWYRWALNGRRFPQFDDAMAYLTEYRPAHPDRGIIWGDARPGNLMFGDDLRVAAVFDWEMAALGPAEVDLGWWLMNDRFYTEGFGLALPEGLPDRDSVIRRYEQLLGRSMRDMEYYEVLAVFRFAVTSVRYFDLQVERGIHPPDTDVHERNPITILLAAYMGTPSPGLSDAFAAAMTERESLGDE